MVHLIAGQLQNNPSEEEQLFKIQFFLLIVSRSARQSESKAITSLEVQYKDRANSYSISAATGDPYHRPLLNEALQNSSKN
jgi:hypothetical protein